MQERSYSGKQFRPSPEILLQEDGSVGIIATPWGGRQGAKRVIDTLSDYILSSRDDMEATSPFQKISSLTPLANSLRAGIMLANDSLYREENRNEYVSGVELVVFAQRDEEIAWAQIGYPNLFLSRRGVGLIPMGGQLDLAAELSSETVYPPLPANVLGLNATSNFSINSFRPLPGDRLIFLSRSRVPQAFYNLNSDAPDLDQMTRLLSADAPDLPFWLGLYEIPVRAV